MLYSRRESVESNLIMVKNMLRQRRPAPFCAAVLLFWALAGEAASAAPAPEHPAIDWRTGLAIYGFDPVAYFAEGRAVAGVAEHENAFAGATWRFHNAGNRAAFAEHPGVYMPAFGGHDPVAVARGVALPGNPLIFALHGGRLFLFTSERSRNGFLLKPQPTLEAAESRWPALSATLAP